MKKIKLLALSLLFAQMSFAQPANDNCTGAITLTPGPVCIPTAGTTAGATQSQIGCTGNANDDVWYTFTATSTGHSVNVSGNGTFNPVLQIFQGSCGVFSIACVNATGAGGTESWQSTGLTVGTQYWIRVYDLGAGVPSNTTFDICISQPITEPPCDPNSPEPANSMSPCPQIPKICRVNGFCGTTQGYHLTPGATTLTPYAVNTWAQLTTAFCGSIENNSFIQFTATGSNVQLRIYGSCATGSGIQMLAFSLDSGACGSGAVTTYGCQYLNFNTAPVTGIPLTFTGMVPGQTYYLMIDGFAGAICNYKVGADYGVQVSAFVSPNLTDICVGSTVQLGAGGGDGVYTWDPEPTLDTLAGPVVTASPPAVGTYTYVVNSLSTDTTCPANADTAIINVYDLPTPDAGIDDTICFISNSGIINLNGVSSNPINTILWQFIPPVGTAPAAIYAPSSGTDTTSVIVNQPGLYKFVMTETNPICGAFTDTVDVIVMSHQQTLTYTPPTCAGDSNATITVNNPDAVEYSFGNDSTWQASNTHGGFSAGTHIVYSRNFYNCEISSTITVVDPPAVTIAVSNDTLICENGTSTLTAVATNGNTFDYNWMHTANLSGTQNVSPTTAGYYYVSATSDAGCISNTDSIFVDLNPPLNGSFSSDVTICPGDNTIITSNAQDGNGGPYTHTWSTTATGSGISHSITESPSTTTNYVVTITDNCESSPVSFNMNVNVAPVPQPSMDVVIDSMCSPGVFTVFNTTDPATVQSIQWNISDDQGYLNQDTITTGNMAVGAYDVTLTVVSPNGCVNSLTETDYIVSMPLPTSNFRFSPGIVTAYSTQVSFDNLSVGNYYNYWTFPNANPGTSSEGSPTVLFPEALVDNYNVELIVETAFGCADTSYQIIEVLPEVLIFAPNTFTPDGDEHNGTWRVFIEGVDPSAFELTMYNRWGQMVWQSFDITAPWDGTYNGVLVPTGTYTWKLVANDALNGEGYIWTGHVNVLK